MSQSTLAGALGVTFQQVQKYEKGTNRVGASRLLAIAEVLGVEIGYFFPPMQKDQGMQAEPPIDLAGVLDSTAALSVLRDFSRISDPALRNALRLLVNTIASQPPKE